MERFSAELIKAVQKLSGVEVTTLLHSGTTRLGAIAFVLKSIPEALRQARDADVVHVGDPVLSLHAWLIRKFLKKPVAVTVHGLDVTYRNPLYQLYLQLFGKFDLCLPISAYAARLLKESKIKNLESRIITPGVHDRYFDPTVTREHLADLIRKTTHYSLSTTHSVLFTAGRLVKRKGHAWFIEHVLPHLPVNTVYVIAGDGPERESIKETVRRLGFAIEGHAQAVLFLGRVSDDDLKILYNTVDAFVQPNITVRGDAEGFGIVLLEAALCQRPVFASRLDGIPDAIHDGKNGRLLPAADADAWIAALTAPPPPISQARDYTLGNFSWPAQAQKYADELRRLIR